MQQCRRAVVLLAGNGGGALPAAAAAGGLGSSGSTASRGLRTLGTSQLIRHAQEQGQQLVRQQAQQQAPRRQFSDTGSGAGGGEDSGVGRFWR
jgi:hypothetical protein